MKVVEEYWVFGEWSWWIIWDEYGLWAHRMNKDDIQKWIDTTHKTGRKDLFIKDTQEVALFYERGHAYVSNRKTGDSVSIPTNWMLR